MKKKFYYKKLKIRTTDNEENLPLFICIFKVNPVETVELIFNFDKKKLGKNLQSTLIYQRTFEELYFIR